MKTLETIVNEASKKYSIDPALIWSTIKQESNFNDMAKGTSGELGLMQIMTATASDMGWDKKTPLTDIELNVNLGAKYLRWLTDYGRKKGYTDVRDIMSMYNQGPGNFEKYRAKRTAERPWENMGYVNSNYSYYQTLKGVNDLNKDLSWSLPIGIGIIGLALFLDKFQTKAVKK